jgi:hypothetical protein
MMRWFFVGLLIVAAGGALLLQREATANLRSEVALLRENQRELATLRAERERLIAAQPAPAEVERLRADRTALNQLRAEIDKMKEHAARREVAAANPTRPSVPAVAIGVGGDGSLSAEGKALDADSLRQRLSGFPKGSRVDVHFVLDPRANVDTTRAAVDQLVAVEKELGLKLNLRFDQKPPGAQ